MGVIAANILLEARKLIADETHWTKGTLARNSAGRAVDPSDENAVHFCPLGAAGKFGGLFGQHCAYLHAAAKEMGYDSMGDLNDAPETTHKRVMEAIDKAIALARANGDSERAKRQKVKAAA